MNNDQLSQTETRTQDIDYLAIFFFFLGVLPIYSSLKIRAREKQVYKNTFNILKTITLTGYGGVAVLGLMVALSY